MEAHRDRLPNYSLQNFLVFSRQPFRFGGEENRFKDEIRREPLTISEEAPFPIATVSKEIRL